MRPCRCAVSRSWTLQLRCSKQSSWVPIEDAYRLEKDSGESDLPAMMLAVCSAAACSHNRRLVYRIRGMTLSHSHRRARFLETISCNICTNVARDGGNEKKSRLIVQTANLRQRRLCIVLCQIRVARLMGCQPTNDLQHPGGRVATFFEAWHLRMEHCTCCPTDTFHKMAKLDHQLSEQHSPSLPRWAAPVELLQSVESGTRTQDRADQKRLCDRPCNMNGCNVKGSIE